MRQTLEVLGLASICLLAGLVLSGFQGSPPPPASSLQVIPGQSVLLTWTGSAGATSYNVYQVNGACPLTGIAGPPVASGITNLTAILTGYGPGTYCWAVTAANANGESSQSNEAALTLLPGKYDDLGTGAGIVKTAPGVVPATLSVDNTVVPFSGAGSGVPAKCTGPNQFYLQTHSNATTGQLTNFKILLCDPVTLTFKNLPLVKQGG